MKRILLLSLLGLIAFTEGTVLNEQTYLKVITTSGTLHGKSAMTLNLPVREFLGVPYAEPPVGDLRFKPPVEFVSTSTIRDATEFAAGCMQPEHLSSVISTLLHVKSNFSEDCLYLNIYVPVVEETVSPLPVMVWLSGEGFDYSDPQQFDGSYFAVLGKTIVITVNYRLSAFGFLSAMITEAPGNVGLLDQRVALKWVKRNINNFGGDNSKITLFGRFTGAMSAAIHAFSPLSKEEQLFTKIILQSGVPVGDWVFDRNPLELTNLIAQELECERDNIEETIECLKQKPANILLSKAVSLPQKFRPIYDNELIVETNDVNKSNFATFDAIIGLNEDEGSLCTIALKAVNSPLYEKMQKNELSKDEFMELLQTNLRDFYKKDDDLSVKLTAHKYTSSPSKGSLTNLFVKFCGDLFIKSHSFKLAAELVKNGLNAYVYKFNHRPLISIAPNFIGAGHGDDVLFSLGLTMSMTNISHEESALTRQMIQSFSNFAKTGDPNPLEGKQVWKKYPSIMNFPYRSDVIREELGQRDSRIERIVEFFQDILPEVQGQRCK